ncbi:antirestriction protein ArdA [Desulfosporosinus metallidurans]|uniref:Seryl-tRNA synthetase n=1 Tax=Desulfosporosinus metallidurans TaxID=1888891 RepID=A0A1Q8QRX2_9FIRM|nr:antirestriction protein ArdA [Desulfosporosinus metallidurans]OLN30067.1 Seryl-tRNA synthetase [Desulfosporosinus metallidurans]
MSEIQKVMTITLMRADFYDSPAYTGAYLRLPANQNEMQDAMERARITASQPFKIVECYNNQGEYIDFIPENPSLDELNFIASRLEEMEDWQKIAFKGLVQMEKTPPTMQTLINITYNMDDIQCVPVKNDAELGEFYLDNGFVDAVNEIPDEYMEGILEFIDLEKVGRIQRKAEGGVYMDSHYVVKDFENLKQVYDGSQLPEQSAGNDYVFNLLLENGVEELKNNGGQCLALPASPEEISEALRYLKATSLDDCIIARSESIIPRLDNNFSFSEDIEKISILADRIKELESQGMLSKYKAVLEFTDCTDIDHTLDLTQNLNCFDFYPEMSSPEDFGKLALLKASGLKPDDIAFKYLEFTHYGYTMMEKDGVNSTAYGLVRRNEKELVLEYCRPSIGQQMI